MAFAETRARAHVLGPMRDELCSVRRGKKEYTEGVVAVGGRGAPHTAIRLAISHLSRVSSLVAFAFS